MSNQEYWTAKIENKEKVTLDDVKFIFEQAEKQLKETGDISQIIVARTTTLISLISGILTAIIIFTVNKWEVSSSTFISPITISSIIGSVYLFCVSYSLAQNIVAKDYAVLGRIPEKLFTDTFFVNDIERKQ